MFEDGYTAKQVLVVAESLVPYPCIVDGCPNTYLGSAFDGPDHCLCDECNRAKWAVIQDDDDFLKHQDEIGMTLQQYREFVQEHGQIGREISLKEHSARIYQREINLLMCMG